eukprot:Hpha_TRINITY_DN36899_c0_g1::TRINITY_DN36899_c0_g1_i1::g.139779::m.139779
MPVCADVPVLKVSQSKVGVSKGNSQIWFTTMGKKQADGSTAAQLTGFSAADVANTDDRFVAAEFTQLLIHLAVGGGEKKKMMKRRPAAAFEHFLLHQVLPHAGGRDSTALRQQIWSEPVQEVLRKCKREMQWLFRFVAAKDAVAQKKKGGPAKGAPADPNTVSTDEWLLCLEEIGAIDKHTLTVDEARVIFRHAQLDADGDDDTMVYCEFEDAIAIVALYKVPAVYLPFHQRVGRYLQTIFLPRVQQLQSTTEPQLATARSFTKERSSSFRSGGGSFTRKSSRNSRLLREARPPSRADSKASLVDGDSSFVPVRRLSAVSHGSARSLSVFAEVGHGAP